MQGYAIALLAISRQTLIINQWEDKKKIGVSEYWVEEKRNRSTHLFHHLILFVEELHLDVPADGQRLGELKHHVLVLAPRVSRVGGVDLHLELVHHKLGVCKKKIPSHARVARWSGW